MTTGIDRRRPAVAGARTRDMSKPLPAALSWTVLLAYGVDKSAARAGRARVSEQTLLTVGLIGGWPGALIAQRVFRHKTRKRAFRRVFCFTVFLNTAALAGLVFATQLL